jgi:hypothetical protein
LLKATPDQFFMSAMNLFSHNCVLIVASGFIFTSCTKTSNNNSTGTGPTGSLPDSVVYVAGDNGTNPILWENGKADTLSATTGTAAQVIVSGTDVYVAGICQEVINYSRPGVLNGPITGQYAYWKNGVQTNIGSFGDIVYNNVSIAVIGSDVYFANGAAWKNGTVLALPGMGNGFIVSAFADGSDIYFSGTDSAEDIVYWKNGQLNVISAYQGRGSILPHISCLDVSGTDVYAGGMFNQAAYWKNGTINYLQYPSILEFVPSVTSIFVSGSDVYTTGFLDGTINGVAAYYKNGIENDLPLFFPPNPATLYTTTTIFLMGSDIYVAGYSTTLNALPGGPETTAPVFWKNGVEAVLSASGYARSIYYH